MGCFGLEEFCSEVALLHFAFAALAELTGVVSRVAGTRFMKGPTESSGACAQAEGAGDKRARGGLLALVPMMVSRGSGWWLDSTYGIERRSVSCNGLVPS